MNNDFSITREHLKTFMLKSIDHIFDEMENLEHNKAVNDDLDHEFDLTIKDKGHSLEELFHIIFTDILHRGPRTTSPHFFGHIPAGGFWGFRL